MMYPEPVVPVPWVLQEPLKVFFEDTGGEGLYREKDRFEA